MLKEHNHVLIGFNAQVMSQQHQMLDGGLPVHEFVDRAKLRRQLASGHAVMMYRALGTTFQPSCAEEATCMLKPCPRCRGRSTLSWKEWRELHDDKVSPCSELWMLLCCTGQG